MSWRNEEVSSYVYTKVNIRIIHFIFEIPGIDIKHDWHYETRLHVARARKLVTPWSLKNQNNGVGEKFPKIGVNFIRKRNICIKLEEIPTKTVTSRA